MGRTCGLDTVLLLDNYGEESRMLHQSFKKAGYRGHTVVIDDDGFLPEDVISLYRFFLGPLNSGGEVPGRPRYFNQINIPDYWEIEANSSTGKVMNLSKQRGTIYYAASSGKRLVRVVDWSDENGVVRSCDHYDCYGVLYARTTLNHKGKRFCKTYFDAAGREIIVENYVTHDIILNRDGKIFVYHSKEAFILKLFEEAGIKYKRIFFNSLSTPFFVSQLLKTDDKRDVLFWQENPRNDIPGNMQIILNGNATRTSKICVQNRESYDKLISIGANASILNPLGFVHDYERENRHGKDILTCTNSDQIAKLEYLVKSMPDMCFHIAAVTEMSSSLMAMAHYENVHVYPNIKEGMCHELYEKCDYYLDINYYSEILSAVKTAYMHNQLIVAFNDTLHNRTYTADEHVFTNAEDMISLIKDVKENASLLDEHLDLQRQHAMAETVDAYYDIID